MDISVEGKKIIIEPILAPEKYELEDLVSKVKESNILSSFFCTINYNISRFSG